MAVPRQSFRRSLSTVSHLLVYYLRIDKCQFALEQVKSVHIQHSVIHAVVSSNLSTITLALDSGVERGITRFSVCLELDHGLYFSCLSALKHSKQVLLCQGGTFIPHNQQTFYGIIVHHVYSFKI